MNKRRIMTLALALCMVAILAVGGTLAYFTEAERQTNIFTIGDIEIDLYETTEHKDGAGATKTKGEKDLGQGDDENRSFKYEDIMPGDVMTKKVTVENIKDHDVYVSLAIKNNGYLKFNQNIDDYYEAKTVEELQKLTGYTFENNAGYMQQITDDIWYGTGWDLQYAKDDTHHLRYEMINPAYTIIEGSTEGSKVLGYGYANSTQTAQGNRVTNYEGKYFPLAQGQAGDLEGNFDTIDTDHTRMWVIYLKLTPGAKYTVDLTTTCPKYITTENIEAFDDMELEIQASAIQADGFKDDEEGQKAAFTELHNTFGFGY